MAALLPPTSQSAANLFAFHDPFNLAVYGRMDSINLAGDAFLES